MVPFRKRNILPAVLTSALAGCAADSGIIDSLLIVPGAFESMECPELIARYASESAQVTKLTMLMEKSANDPAGPIVNSVVYNTDYAKARAAQSAAERAARVKNCDLTKPDANPASADVAARGPEKPDAASLLPGK